MTTAAQTAAYLHPPGVVCALGLQRDDVSNALFNPVRRLPVVSDRWSPGRPLAVGCVPDDLPALPPATPASLRSRNNAAGRRIGTASCAD